MKISKIYLRICSLLFACFLVCGSILRPVVTYASPYDLMIQTNSNASTFALPRSSIVNLTNTVNWDYGVTGFIHLNDGTYYSISSYIQSANKNDGVRVKFSAPSGKTISRIDTYFRYGVFNYMPSAGVYDMSIDVSSNFSQTYNGFALGSIKRQNNVADVSKNYQIPLSSVQTSSGDFYVQPVTVHYTGSTYFSFSYSFKERPANVDYTLKVNFTPSANEPDFVSAGSNAVDSDYQAGVSDSLSDLSSSVDTMTGEISEVTEAIQNLQGAMEPHYSNVLTQLHHITEQLHAFYDQVYNNIHLPQLNMLTLIKEAIENIDLQIEVDISEVKTAINNMSTAVQNKLQSTTDQITGGYDNSGLESDKSELDGVLNQYEQAEEDLFGDAKGNINDFEYDTPLDEFIGPLNDISYFLSGLFTGLGVMNVVISFSLTLTIAMVMIGWYRFKGGK